MAPSVPEATTRPSWNEYFMSLARAAAVMGTCDRRRVGAVAVRERRVLATGFNGALAGARHCDHGAYADPADDPDLHVVDERRSCARAAHAEANLVTYAARYGVALAGASVFTTTYPCLGCARLLAAAGVVGICYDEAYHNAQAVASLCVEAKVLLVAFRVGS
jgi:dCMP deaminase